MDDLGGKVVDGLYVGSLEDARKAVGTGGVTHVLSVCSDKLECAERDVATHQVELLDVEEADLLGVLPECLDWIDAAIKLRGRVFVHCNAGVSRSVAVVAAYLMRTQQVDVAQALARVRLARPDGAPNEGFVAQLELFHAMQCTIDTSHRAFRLHRLQQVAQSHLLGAADPTASLASDPEAVRGKPGRQLRCKKCRRVLVLEEGLVPHETAENRMRLKRGDVRATECTSWFVEPVEWMQEVALGCIEGKIMCPKCNARVGMFNWAGLTCSCSRWITPAFQLQKSKIDFI